MLSPLPTMWSYGYCEGVNYTFKFICEINNFATVQVKCVPKAVAILTIHCASQICRLSDKAW